MNEVLPTVRCCWRAVTELGPGMTLARPALGQQGSRATLLIGAGATLTDNTIAQLVARGVESVAVLDPLPAAEQLAAATAAYEQRLDEIFGEPPADAATADLRAALRELGPCLC